MGGKLITGARGAHQVAVHHLGLGLIKRAALSLAAKWRVRSMAGSFWAARRRALDKPPGAPVRVGAKPFVRTPFDHAHDMLGDSRGTRAREPPVRGRECPLLAPLQQK